ncbi:cuticular protein precursor [Tribolium castaneum]|uniref:Pupal cuticle protein Edg-84A-like Protein n=1 Tax=Tribolium castaneum TaxID=7070 RepID=D6X0Y0_TRICA|nr:cuticular protein precursor [Tribolium castaneum]EFA10573.1 hypothetical protein TcasGA2_TC012829 [Tribolium castaneum]|eukprot:NP_001161313.1 cuticular protein precursor [Tribolium castaneum]
MKSLVLLIVATLTYGTRSSHVVPVGVTVGLTPYSHPISSLYHSQDIIGQYAYGYATPTSTKAETKTADGVTHGGYSYIDSNGILQTVQYTADPIHGFRVAATNLPQDVPEVAYAKAKHLADFNAIAAHHANPAIVPQPIQDLPEVSQARARHLATLQAAYAGSTAPQPVQDLPEVAKARAEHLAAVAQVRARDAAIHLSPVEVTGNVVPVHTVAAVGTPISYPAAISGQYHSQDGLGQYSYGYVGPLSSKSETKTADGVTRGGYSYIDANGVLQTVHYISDPVNGFRVAATNLPVAGPSHGVVSQKIAKVVPGIYTQEVYY